MVLKLPLATLQDFTWTFSWILVLGAPELLWLKHDNNKQRQQLPAVKNQDKNPLLLSPEGKEKIIRLLL